MSSENKSLLTKGIGGIGAALLVLNGLIGAGIFALPAKMAAELGAFSPYIFLIFGTLMLAIVWCFGQLAALYQETGGPVVYAQKGFGDAAAFQTGFIITWLAQRRLPPTCTCYCYTPAMCGPN